MRALPDSWFATDTRVLAQHLLDCYIVRIEPDGSRTGGRIVETEAYLTGDPANHAYRGPTPRNRVMFERDGRWYIYRIYGVHHCLNVVNGPEGVGEAVLIRALEPLWGLDTMRLRRGRSDEELTNGPGKVCAALAIDGRANGTSISGRDTKLILVTDASDCGEYAIEPRLRCPPTDVVALPRVGISRAKERLWRFTLLGNRYCSRPRPVGGLRRWDLPEEAR